MVQMQKTRHALKQAKREAKQEQQETEQQQKQHHHRKKKIKKYSVLAVVALIVVFSIFFFTFQQTSEPGPYDAFAKCLTEEGIKMYGAFWCPHCADQKKLFGKSFTEVDYVECDPGGKNAQPDVCKQQGIQSYPTWIVAGKRYSGLQPLQRLADLSGCPLP